MELTVIKANSNTPERLRVAAYCRVSREGEEQETSIENQKSHYEAMIMENPDSPASVIMARSGSTVYILMSVR